MTDKTSNDQTQPAPKGERIAKHLARAGVASRRGAEALITEGRIAVNGRTIHSPALNVAPHDKITLDGQPIAAAEPTRMWLYHKPTGLVTSAKDDKGRTTVFDDLPEDMPRVMSIGRLDLNSEGLLLLTNDGEIKRRLELPSTGWARRYRVRVHGRVADEKLNALREGITVEGIRYQPMLVSIDAIDRQQNANTWLTVTIREGKNREIRRAMEAIGVTVNRLIRTSYGPFKLEELKRGEVREIKRRVLRDQLGLDPFEEESQKKPVQKSRKAPHKPSRPRQPYNKDDKPANGSSSFKKRPTSSATDARTKPRVFSGKKPSRGPLHKK